MIRRSHHHPHSERLTDPLMWSVRLVLPNGHENLHTRGLAMTEALELTVRANSRALQYGASGFYKAVQEVPPRYHSSWHVCATWFTLMAEYDDSASKDAWIRFAVLRNALACHELPDAEWDAEID